MSVSIMHVVAQVHADLAILPTSTVCGDPDTHLVNMLRHALLQVMDALLSSLDF